jgi:nicotinamidase-related amidase
VVRKEESDTFSSNPELARALRVRGVERVVVAGMQSEFCIEATSRGVLGEGFAVVPAVTLDCTRLGVVAYAN